MSVAIEFMHALAQPGHPSAGAGTTTAAPEITTFNDVQEDIRASIMNGLGHSGSVRHLSEVGANEAAGGSFDVITVNLDTVYRASDTISAGEILGRCRPGGRIGIACPTPGSFLDRVRQLIGRYAPPSAIALEAGFVGTRENLNAHFGNRAIALGARDRVTRLYYSSPEHWLARWRSTYAPMMSAFSQIEPEWRDTFSDDLIRLAKEFTEIDSRGRFIRCDYLEFLVHTSEA
jgi:hypothetical protein